MPLFMVERRLPGMTMARLLAGQQAALAAAARTDTAGRVRYVGTTYIASESRCLCLFEAPDREAVRTINEAAALPFSRIVQASDLTP
jgi:hypothetical protein